MKKMTSLLLAGVMIFSLTACSTTNKSDEESIENGEQSAGVISQEEKAPEDYVANLKLMVHSEGQPSYMIEKFNEVYPNIHIELVMVPSAEQQQTIMTMASSGSDVPDMFTCRTQFVKAIVNSDNYYLDLNSLGASDWTDEIEDYVVQVGTDTNGALRALSWQCPVGGVFYRRSMAIDYFGTDDPDEMAEHFSSWDAILETARTVKEKSNGSVYFCSDAVSDMAFLGVTEAGGFVVDGKLNTGDKIQKIFEVVKTMYDEDLVAKNYIDGTADAALGNTDGLFCVAKPTWGLNYNIMANWPDQEGDWALTSGPAPYTAGGTYIGISKDTEYPEECYQFIKFILSNEEFVRSYALEFGDYVSNKAIQEEIGQMDANEMDLPIFKYLGGQNAYSYWNGELEKGVNATAFSADDEYASQYLNSAINEYASGTVDLETALQTYKDDMKNFDPSLDVD